MYIVLKNNMLYIVSQISCRAILLPPLKTYNNNKMLHISYNFPATRKMVLYILALSKQKMLFAKIKLFLNDFSH